MVNLVAAIISVMVNKSPQV